MNAALLIVSSALAVGGNVTQIGWGEGSAPIVQAGCTSCAPAAPTCGDPCCSSRTKLLDKLRARLAPKCKTSCAPACEPAPACPPAPTCAPACQDPCSKTNLLDKLRARLAGRKSSCCASACGGCSAGTGCSSGAAAPPVTEGGTPKEMPKTTPAKDAPKTGGGNTSFAPPPALIPTPVAIPVAPAANTKPLNSPY
jgi:hypothetical protein